MLTSLKVVRMALVVCDCSSRSATRARRRDIGTRCSGRSPRFGATGAATAGNGLAAAVGAGAARGLGAALVGAASAPSTSPLVTRPSLPVPGTEPGASSLSAISLAAAGIATSALLPAGGRCRGGAAAGAAAAADAQRAAAGGLAFGVDARDHLLAERTRAAVGLHQLASTPSAGAGTSSTTLSVSISIRISSIADASPGFFFHCSSVASATDSDSCGTLTSRLP